MTLRFTLAAAAIICLTMVPSVAREPEETFQELEKCSVIPDGPTRLACYDKLMPRVRAGLAAGPEELSREDQTSLFGFNFSGIFGSSEASTPENFGSSDLQHEPAPGSAHPLESITATVTDIAMTPHGKFIVFLDNGQVWRQQEADTGRADFRSKPSDNKVEISRAMMGSYTLSINGSNKSYRVNRVK